MMGKTFQTGHRPETAIAGLPCVECPLSAVFQKLALWLCVFLIAGLAADRASAQSITIDPASAVEAASGTITMNHTVGNGANRFLIVSVAIERNDATVSSATYAGQPLFLLGRFTDPGTGATQDIWGAFAPTSGTNQLVVTLNTSAAVVVGAISFANVDQASPLTGQFFFGTSGTLASGSIATTTGQLVLATIAANDEVDSVTPGAGQTSRWNVVNAADVIGAGSTKPASATSTTMSYSMASSGRWVMAVIALQPANPFVVTTTNDSGAGSLREAINAANASGAADTISFNIPGAGPHTITLASALPALSGNGDRIDGTTQLGTQCRNIWNGDAHILRVNVRAASRFDGLRLSGANQTVRGLTFTGFENAVRTLAASNTATIQCNYLGLLADGSSNGNTRGVLVEGASARIGGLDAGQGNVISANSIAGVVTTVGTRDTSIQGNFIGTDPTGMTARANGSGINNFFGTATWRDITRNLISGNTNSAIILESDDQVGPSTDLIRIQRNVVGFNRDHSALMRNGGDGIRFQSGSISNALIGGDAASQGNVITGNEHGVSLTNLENVFIRGNIIARSLNHGIRLSNMRNTTVGGDAVTQGNIIGGNGWSGIIALNSSDNITIIGNQIGRVTITGGDFDNQQRGIMLDNVSNVSIGNGTAAGRNLISRNGQQAVLVVGTISNVVINGNYIGIDASGTSAVSNGENTDVFNRDALAFVDGTSNGLSILNNVVGGYEAALVTFWGHTGSNIAVQGNSLGIGADGVSQITSGNIEPLIHIGGGSSFANLLIGGSSSAQGNIIAYGGASGVQLAMSGTNHQLIGNTIRNNGDNGVEVLGTTRTAIIGNSIHSNGLLGIDLNLDGVTPNDAGDGDTGPNDLLNFPDAIRANVLGPDTLQTSFSFDAPAADYRIEFFASTAADPSGHGEGERYLGYLNITHAGGVQSHTGSLATLGPVSVGDIISATATRRTVGGTWDITSEFSAVVTADGVAALTVAMASEVFDPPAGNPFATPGNDVLLTTTISNGGSGSTDADSLFVAIAIDPANTFFNDVTPALGGIIGFQSAAPALTFTPGTDLRFSNSIAAPGSLAECTYTPVAGYDSQVRHVCLNPKGSLPSGGTDGQLTVQIRVRIN